MLLLYAVVPAGAPLPAGVHALRRVDVGPIGAVVETRDQVPSPERPDVLRFGEVVRSVAAGGPALPVRFGTVLPDDAEVAHLLHERQDELASRLQTLVGHVEVILHVEDESAPTPAPPGETSGREYLLSRVAAVRHREDLLAALESALDPWAREFRRLPAAEGVRLACLVPGDRVDEVRAAVDLWARAGRRVQMTGPWPAFSFSEPEGTP